MNVKNLRIGNLLQDRKNNIVPVTEIRADEFTAISEENMITHLPISGIAITKEWLKSFGFTEGKYESFTLSEKGFQIDFELVNGQNYGSYLEGVGIDILYVHELQNLYYNLTKKELNH
jgi:hypothetical protein